MNLTSEQINAINEIDHNLQIIACAGSGKTEVITRRIVNILEKKEDIKATNIVAFTFTEKAADSLLKRISKACDNRYDISDMYIGTIHGFCRNILKDYSKDFKDFITLDNIKNHMFINKYEARSGIKELNLKGTLWDVKNYCDCISKMIDDYDNKDKWNDKAKTAFDCYQKVLYEHKYLDYNLLIFETINQIKNDPNVQEYLKTIKYLVVDEYQDIDDLQEKLISLIVSYGANICVVGDDDQSIYKFRGGNPDNMLEFTNRYQDVCSVKLEKNFRSNKQVIDVANTVIKNNTKRLDKTMISNNNKDNTTVKAESFSTDADEYNYIANEIIRLHSEGIEYKEMAILLRKSKHIEGIVETLVDKKIPCKADSASLFFNSDNYKCLTKLINSFNDYTDRAKIYEALDGYIDKSEFKYGCRYINKVMRNGGRFKVSELLTNFLKEIKYFDNDIDGTRTKYFNSFVSILNDFDEVYNDWSLKLRIAKLSNYLNRYAKDEYKYYNFDDNDDDAVQIMTIHKSKGLEFETVFIPKLERNEFPVRKMGGRRYYSILGNHFKDSFDRYQTTEEDERKLFYVAATRAKQNLYLTYTLNKQPVSIFVQDASNSKYLDIDLNSLKINAEKYADDDFSYAKADLMEYYESIKDYDSTACDDIYRLDSMSNSEIIEEYRQRLDF